MPSESQNRITTPTAAAFRDWIEVCFDAVGRMVVGAVPLGVIIFAIIELVNPSLLGQKSISPELAQTLLGAGLGTLGMDIVGRRGGRK